MPEAQSEPVDAKLKKAWAKRLKELQVEKEKRETARRFMDIPAYERLMNVRMSNYTLYMQMLDLIIATAQSKRMAGKITEEQLKDVLYKLTSKPDTKIEFRHKCDETNGKEITVKEEHAWQEAKGEWPDTGTCHTKDPQANPVQQEPARLAQAETQDKGMK